MVRMIVAAALAAATGSAAAQWQFATRTDPMTDRQSLNVLTTNAEGYMLGLRQDAGSTNLLLLVVAPAGEGPSSVRPWMTWRVDRLRPRSTLPLGDHVRAAGRLINTRSGIGMLMLDAPGAAALDEAVELLAGRRLIVQYPRAVGSTATVEFDLSGMAAIALDRLNLKSVAPAGNQAAQAFIQAWQAEHQRCIDGAASQSIPTCMYGALTCREQSLADGEKFQACMASRR